MVKHRVTAGGAVAFFVLGLVAAAYGPLLPRIRETFGLSAATAGLLISAQFAGSVVGILTAGLLARRVAVRVRLVTASVVLAVGCVAAAAAPSWPVLLTAVLVAGVGWGGFELDVNVLFSHSHGVRSVAVLNVLSAAFGAGAVAAPVLVVSGAGRGMVFGVAAGVAVLALVLLAGVPGGAGGSGGSVAPAGRTGGLWAVLTVVLVVYVALEGATSGWMPTYLAGLAGGAALDGAVASAAFWALFTLGRLIAAPVSLRVSPGLLVPVTLVLAAAALLLSRAEGAAPYAFALTGLFLAPVFPSALAWQAQRAPAGVGATALVIATASFGPVVALPFVGAVADAGGTASIPVSLIALSLFGAGVAAVAARWRASAPISVGSRRG